MKLSYYHATSFHNATSIEQGGFIPSYKGSLGPGIYFAEKPKCALKKAQCKTLDAIIVVHLDAGRIKNVTKWSNWTKNSLNNLGFDSVRKANCATGSEICIFDIDRIKIIGVVHWNDKEIEIKEYFDHSVNVSEFQFLMNGKKLKIIKKDDQPNESSWPIQKFNLFGSFVLNI